jgi:SAM-dependent methyltransferase
MNPYKILRESINLHWLRPDNALWVFGFVRTFGKLVQEKNSIGRSMDLGCGDGTTSFVMLGGSLDARFDVFHSVQAQDENLTSDTRLSSSGSLVDEAGDFYNCYNTSWKEAAEKNILTKPSLKFSVGADWKEVLVKKASAFGFYEGMSVFDANVIPYPYDEEFDFIFCTMIYWLEDREKSLREIHRILNREGCFAFSAPKPEILNYTLSSMMANFNYPLLNRLDRGRFENWRRHAMDKAGWDNLLAENGFEIVEYKEFHPALQIAGGETIIRTLMSAYQVLYDRLLPDHVDIFLEFKQKWCSEIAVLLEPFADDKYYDCLEKTYHAYVVRKL